MLANIAARITEKCWGAVIKKKKRPVAEQKSAVVATSTAGGIYGMPGSYEDLKSKIRKALEDSQLYGKYPEIVSTFPKKVFVSTDGKGGPDQYWEIEWRLEGDEVKLGVAREIQKKVQFIVKEWAEHVKCSL